MNELLTRKEYELKDLRNDIFYKNKNQIQKILNISIKKIQDKMSSAKNSLKKYQKILKKVQIQKKFLNILKKNLK